MSRFDNGCGPLDGQEPSFKVVHNGHGAGETLEIIFNHSELGSLDATAWLWMDREFCIQFAHAFCRANLSNAERTREGNFENLTYGFVTWIRETKGRGEVGSKTFDKALLDEFDKWVYQTEDDGSYRRGKKATLRHWRSALRNVIKEFENGDLADTPASKTQMRRAPTARHQEQDSHYEPYTIEEFAQILHAIRKEIKTSLAFFNERERLLSAGHRALLVERKMSGTRTVTSDRMSKARLLASVQSQFGPIMPYESTIRRDAPDLHDHIQDYGYRNIFSILHPSAHNMLPFCLQIAAVTGFNLQPLIQLERGMGVRIERAFGAERLVFRNYKNRKQGKVMSAYNDTDQDMTAPFLIRRVFAWNKDLRQAANQEIADHVWLYASGLNAGERAVRSFGQLRPKESVTSDFNNAIAKFTERNNIKRVAVGRIKVTLAGLANDIFGGDLRAVMDFLQHESAETTLRNYMSGISIARHREIIAIVQQLRERYILSLGRIDARLQSSLSDPSAATPGWLCLNPYDSPIAGERKGRLCQAYGECPACPLAYIDFRSVFACAKVMQVKAELENAKLRVLPKRWSEGLLIQHVAIEMFWILGFSAELVEQAKKVHLLPILPIE